MTWLGLTWPGLEWRGLAWLSLAWLGLAWRAVPCRALHCFALEMADPGFHTATAMRCDSHCIFISAFGFGLMRFVHGLVCVMFGWCVFSVVLFCIVCSTMRDIRGCQF